jgi:hypothetical protein
MRGCREGNTEGGEVKKKEGLFRKGFKTTGTISRGLGEGRGQNRVQKKKDK